MRISPPHRRLTLFLSISVLLHALVLLQYLRSDIEFANQTGASPGVTLHISLQHAGQTAQKHEQVSKPEKVTRSVSNQGIQPSDSITSPAARQLVTHREKVEMVESGRPSTDTPHIDAAEARAQVLSHVREDFSRHFYYPPLARRHGWQGQVQLGFSVTPNGMIKDVYVQQGSGYAVLDESAQNALNRIKQLYHVQHWLAGQSLQLQLSVVYRLQGG